MNNIIRIAFRTLIPVALVVTVSAARAQDASVGYKVQHWSVTTTDANPSACTTQVDGVRESLNDFAVPVSKQFSWVVVCDEKAWFHLKNSSPRYARVNTVTGFTDFDNHVVYLKGFKKSAGDLRYTAAHEIGHQMCHCFDEASADSWKLKLLSAKTYASLVARAHNNGMR